MDQRLTLKEMRRLVAPYAVPEDRKALWQVVSTTALFAAFLGLMYVSLAGSYALTLLLSVPAGLLLLRLFVLQHDCGHGSLFRSKTLNLYVGRPLAFLALTPYRFWRHMHHIHHNQAGRLDATRSDGYFWFYTKEEYRAASRRKQLLYRFYRHPLILLVIGPPLFFFFGYRLTCFVKDPLDRRSIVTTNILLLTVLVLLYAFGLLTTALLIYLPVMVVAAVMGTWLFYVQHAYEGTYWERGSAWDPARAAVEGSSYYRLPLVLDWVSASIGYHSVHHLHPGIPNYRLRECWRKTRSAFSKTPEFTIRSSLALIGFSLWDEEHKRIIRFSDL